MSRTMPLPVKEPETLGGPGGISHRTCPNVEPHRRREMDAIVEARA